MSDSPRRLNYIAPVGEPLPGTDLVVVPRHLLDELVDAWTNDGNITRCDDAAQALVAAVVEAVGPTT